ncbi:hypothetical protein EJ05DRAFT_497423 [Pseudovirgaria hyperparasitica]|uniref:Uncharacterized protein n=1 Tax=Pseudovirgaria hyperparasitica TaxID=470096 RepID=A0A6A6WDE5_9PEZI|nr:uncharacterized protein EJ05DRAFT_497423 [Pseudovirgaria hyperparasitica]KAF2760852.1 hypothetical protein EJ05DRAFT_497423 [Pseudovirgaria hyperparasitica]
MATGKRKRQDLTGTLSTLKQWSGTEEEEIKLFENHTCFRSVDSKTQFDVDVTILDYMVYKCIKSLIKARENELNGAKPHWNIASGELEAVHEWLGLLKPALENRKLPTDAEYRLRLLYTTSIFTCRYRANFISDSALQDIRRSNSNRLKEREDGYVHSHVLMSKYFPLEEQIRYQYVSFLVNDLQSNHRYDLRSDVEHVYASLRDILVIFLEQTLARTYRYAGEINERLLELFGEWMLQASVESYLHLGSHGSEPLNEIFAFGFGTCSLEERPSVQELFCDDEAALQESPMWTDIRQRYMNKAVLLLEAAVREGMHLPSESYPVRAFELKVLSYLKALSREIVLPDLQQVIAGKIDIEGISSSESKRVIDRIRPSCQAGS